MEFCTYGNREPNKKMTYIKKQLYGNTFIYVIQHEMLYNM